MLVSVLTIGCRQAVRKHAHRGVTSPAGPPPAMVCQNRCKFGDYCGPEFRSLLYRLHHLSLPLPEEAVSTTTF
jgi:hypothetical protein